MTDIRRARVERVMMMPFVRLGMAVFRMAARVPLMEKPVMLAAIVVLTPVCLLHELYAWWTERALR